MFVDTETASDQSDVEGRIRALSEDLKRRKMEAERLKKEQKKRQKEKLWQQEQTLKNQIEVRTVVIFRILVSFFFFFSWRIFRNAESPSESFSLSFVVDFSSTTIKFGIPT